MTNPIQFYVPMIGESLNKLLGHPSCRFVSQGQKKRLWELLDSLRLPLPQYSVPVHMKYEAYIEGRTTAKMFDCLNFAVTCKQIEDWLVKRDYLINDNREWVKSAHIDCCKNLSESNGLFDEPGILVDIEPAFVSEKPAPVRQSSLLEAIEEEPAF